MFPPHLETEHHIAGEAGHVSDLPMSKTISTSQALEVHQVLVENMELHDDSRALGSSLNGLYSKKNSSCSTC